MRFRTFFLCFLFALPALGAMGFDIYFSFFSEDNPLPNTFQLSQVGWLWRTYEPESFAWAKTNLDPYFWETFVIPALHQPAVVVAAVPAAILYAFLFLVKLISMLQLGRIPVLLGFKPKNPTEKGSFSFKADLDKKPKTRIKYKRR